MNQGENFFVITNKVNTQIHYFVKILNIIIGIIMYENAIYLLFP